MTPDPADPDAASDVALRQLVAIAVQDGRSGNPFQGPLGVPDPTWRSTGNRDAAALRAQIQERFRALERARRARLVSVSVSVSAQTGYAGQKVGIVYENLETGGREQMEVSL